MLATGYWARSAEGRDELVEKGWEPKERCEKTIRKRPRIDFYYTQGMAVRFLGRGIGNGRYKSGATIRR